MRLEHATAPPVQEIAGVKVIPARASFRHTRALFEEAVAESNFSPQVVEADMAHLDDPHWDSLLALQNGVAVAHAGVFAVGELGMIENVYVSPSRRRRGLGAMMMGRASKSAPLPLPPRPPRRRARQRAGEIALRVARLPESRRARRLPPPRRQAVTPCEARLL